MYCPNCRVNRVTEVKMNWIILIILLICGVLPGLIYFAYCLMEKQGCPVCGTNKKLMEAPRSDKHRDD